MALLSHKIWMIKHITVAGFSQTIHVQLKMFPWYDTELWRGSNPKTITYLISQVEGNPHFALRNPFWKTMKHHFIDDVFLCRSAYQNRLGMVCNCVRCLNHITLWLDLSTGDPASSESLKEVILSMMFEVFPKQKWHPSNSFDNRCSLMGQLICGPPDAYYYISN